MAEQQISSPPDDAEEFENFDFDFNIDPSLIGPDTLGAEWLQGFASALDPENSENDVVWKPQPGPQEEAFYADVDELFYGGAAGGGKVLVNNTLLLTPFGWKAIEDVKVGDTVTDVDGGASRVLGVYPHENFNAYKVAFADGATVEVSGGHLWSWWRSNSRQMVQYNYILYNDKKGVHTECSMHRLGTTRDLYEYHQKQIEAQESGRQPYWITMPLSEPICFTRPNKNKHGDTIRIDPYLMGLLIGGSSMTDNDISVTAMDSFIREYVEGLAPSGADWDGEKHLSLRGTYAKELREQLASYGLWNHTAADKFIPEDYLFASLETRYDLMAGLVDSGGYVDDRGHILYIATSLQLAQDVQHLVRSLGCKATITEKELLYTGKNGNRVDGQLAYNVWIQGNAKAKEKFSKTPRKRDLIKPFSSEASEPGRRVVDIKYIGRRSGACLAIDHPTGLHVVQGFIVTHNSDLMLGLAVSELSPHRKAIIFRRSYPELKDIMTRAQEIVAETGARFKAGNQMRFDGLPNGKTLELGSVPNFQAAQKYRGRAHDLKLFDEVPDIPEAVYTFLSGWARTTEKGVPVRIVAAGNPPTTTEGQWVIRRWAPWLDPNHPNPAVPGEKRWFATLDGEDKEITEALSPEGSKGEPFEWTNEKGDTELISPKSRTFIPAKLSDNKYLADTQYKAVLQNMPEPYRSQLLYGDFGLSTKPDPWQVIPTEWVAAAERRWIEAKEAGVVASSIQTNPAFGLDVAEAGADKTVLVKLTGTYMQHYQFIDVDDDDIAKQVDLIETYLASAKRAPIGVDAIGVGVGVASFLKRRNYRVAPIKVSRSSKKRDKTGVFSFLNVRAEIWWRLREALDPYNSNPLCIPPDPKLRAELTSAKYERTPNDKLKIEEKARIRDRLGRSPDIAEALMLAYHVQSRGAVPLRMA